MLFVLAGLWFRVAAVPFHFYAPDVYQGSPTVLAALLSWVPKGVGFVAIVRALTAVISVKGMDDPLVQKAIMISWVVAAATMTLGNTVALLQNNLKRLLAYSSIAHAGYLMIGVTVAFANEPRSGTFYYGCEGIFFYLVAYALMTLGAFGVIIALRTGDRPVETVEDLAGLGSTQPLPALAMAICLLSLSGIPPLAGFWGKLEIFASALRRQPRGDFGSVHPAGRDRRPQRGHRRVLLLADRGEHVSAARQARCPGPRRLARGLRRGCLCDAVALARPLPRPPRPGLARGGRRRCHASGRPRG